MVNKIEIQALLAKGLICADVARKLGVSRQRIHQIVKANSLKVYKRFGPSQKVYKRYRLRQLPRPAGACAVTTPPTCPRCGQPIVPDGLVLPRVKRHIFEAIRRRPGIDAETLRGLVWTGADGGPENRATLHAHINQLNRKWLAPHGLMIKGHCTDGYHVRAVAKCEVA